MHDKKSTEHPELRYLHDLLNLKGLQINLEWVLFLSVHQAIVASSQYDHH